MGPQTKYGSSHLRGKKKKVAILDLEPDHLDGVPAFSSGNTITGVSTATQSFIPDRSVKEPFYFVFFNSSANPSCRIILWQINGPCTIAGAAWVIK